MQWITIFLFKVANKIFDIFWTLISNKININRYNSYIQMALKELKTTEEH